MGDESGYCTIMWNGRDCGANEMNQHKLHQKPAVIQIRWCCEHGGTGREFSIMNAFWKARWWIPTSTVSN